MPGQRRAAGGPGGVCGRARKFVSAEVCGGGRPPSGGRGVGDAPLSGAVEVDLVSGKKRAGWTHTLFSVVGETELEGERRGGQGARLASRHDANDRLTWERGPARGVTLSTGASRPRDSRVAVK